MHAAEKFLLLAAALACAACGSRSAETANTQVAVNTPATDIVTLPPDESDATPTNELQNGVDQPADNSIDLNSD